MNVGNNFRRVFAGTISNFTRVTSVRRFIALKMGNTALVIDRIVVFRRLLAGIRIATFGFALNINGHFDRPQIFGNFT